MHFEIKYVMIKIKVRKKIVSLWNYIIRIIWKWRKDRFAARFIRSNFISFILWDTLIPWKTAQRKRKYFKRKLKKFRTFL